MLILHALIGTDATLELLGLAVIVITVKLIIYGVAIKYLSMNQYTFRASFLIAGKKIAIGIPIAIATFAFVNSLNEGTFHKNIFYALLCLVRFIQWLLLLYAASRKHEGSMSITVRNSVLLSVCSSACDIPFLVMLFS